MNITTSSFFTEDAANVFIVIVIFVKIRISVRLSLHAVIR